MASVSLKDVLGAPQLCGMYETVKTGIPNVFPSGFYATDQEVAADTGSYLQVQGQRQVARIVAYGSPSVARQQKGVTEIPVKLMHSCENLTIPYTKLMGLIRPDSAGSNLIIDEKGVQEISRQVRNAVKTVDNLTVSMLTQLFFLGNNYFDASGNLLPSSAGAKTTSPSAIDTGNIGNLTSVLSGAAVWTNASADIPDQMMQLDQTAIRATGYELKYAFYGKNIPKYLTSNTKMASYLSRNAKKNDDYLSTGRITELANLTWLPAYHGFYEDQNGTNQALVGDNQICFTPEPSQDWLGWINGGYPVPNSIDVAHDGVEMLSNVSVVHGKFMYAQVTADPVTIKLVYGTTTLPTIRVPKAVYTIDVSA